MSSTPANGMSTKELLLEVRSDVKDIAVRLDQKVDRVEFSELQGRVNGLELHGSRQAIDALKEINELRVAQRGLAQTQERREHLDGEFETAKADVSSLKDWRNRFAGAVLVLAPVAGLNGAHIWLGFG